MQSKEIAFTEQDTLTLKTDHHALPAHAVVALILSMFLVGISFGAVAPLVSAILEARGFSEYFTGGVTAMLALAVAVSSPRVGRLVERYGTRRINCIGLVGQAAGFAGLGLALATNELWLFAIRFGLGVAATMTFVAAEVALLRGVAATIRGRVMAAYGSALAVGFMLGVFASDAAYDWIGLGSFALVAGAALLIAPIAWWGMRGEAGNPLPQAPAEADAMANAKAVRLPWRPLWLGLFGAVVFGALDTAVSGTYPVEGMRLGLSRSESLQIVGLMALGMVFSQPACGWLADKCGSRPMLGWIGILGMVFCLGAGFASVNGNKNWIAISFVGIGAAVGGSYPISLKILGDRTPPEKLPLANARFSALYGYAALFGPLGAAFGIDVMESLGYLGWAIPGLCAVALAALIFLVVWDRRHR